MSFFGTSPQPPPPPHLSLLIPPNPAFGPSEASPKGGILLNAQRTPDLASESVFPDNGNGQRINSKEGSLIPGPSAPISPASSSGKSIINNTNSNPQHGNANHSRQGSTASGNSTKSLSVRRTSEPSSPVTSTSTFGPVSPLSETHPSSILDTNAKNVTGSSSSVNGPHPHPPKIRFAPLPDPRRPRSLSTGRNIVTRSTLSGSNGDRTMAYEVRLPSDEYDDIGDEEAVDDEEIDEEDDDGEGVSRSGRSWSKTMSMGMNMGMGMGSWKGTKKLLTGKVPTKRDAVNVTLTSGAPLTKSISTTSGFIGSGAHQLVSTQKRKETLLGPSPSAGVPLGSRRQSSNNLSSSPSHRRNSSLEPPASSTILGTSPGPVKMLNGRVYGSRRQSEAAEREKLAREKEEPAFVEWGYGKAGGGLGANVPRGGGGGFLADDDDGGGMSWVKKRREERERREREERERQLKESHLGNDRTETTGNIGLSSSASSTEVRDLPTIITPNLDVETPLPPVIHISSPIHPSPSPLKADDKPLPISKQNNDAHDQPRLLGQVYNHDHEHVAKAINIVPPPPHVVGKGNPIPIASSGRGVDIFGDGTAGGRHRRRPRPRSTSSDAEDGDDTEDEEDDEDEDDEDEEEDDEDDDDDDGDFEEDPDDLEEEKLNQAARTTSSAAGVEVISRHKD